MFMPHDHAGTDSRDCVFCLAEHGESAGGPMTLGEARGRIIALERRVARMEARLYNSADLSYAARVLETMTGE
jgi:hypothetical protein